jgi:PAS domain S-box-containing protein
MRWLDRSIARRIAVLVAALLLFATGVQSALSYLQVRHVLARAAAERLQALARQWETLFARPFTETPARLTKLASDPALAAALSPGASAPVRSAAAEALQHSLAADRRSVIALLDSAGTPIVQVGPRDQPVWFGTTASAARNAPRVSPYTRLNDSVLYYDVRVPLREGRAEGTLVQRTRTVLSKAAPATLAGLFGTSTRVVIGSPASGVWHDLGRFLTPPPAIALRPDTNSDFSWEGVEYHGVARRIPGTGLVVLVLTPQAVVMAPARVYLWRAAVMGLFAVGLGGLGSVLFGRWLARPLKEMSYVAGAVAAGEGTRRADEHAPGELGALARSFNAMVSQVTQSEARYRLLAENARDIVSLQEADGRLLYVSPSATTLLGYPSADLTGRTVDSLVHPEDLEHVLRARAEALREAGSGAATSTFRVRHSNGEWVWIEALYRRTLLPDGKSHGILSAARDITQRKRLEEQFLQAQKLEAIGQLAGGVAHDFNNLLTAILGGVDAARESMPEEHPARKYLEEVDLASMRAAGLTRQLLTFARHQVVQVQLLDLNAVIGTLDSLLRRVIGEDIHLVTKQAERLPPIRADEGQLGQVLLNLVVNARDAMPEGGRLTIETRAVELDTEYAKSHHEVIPGRYVLLAVTDTGSGITPEVAAHLFEPFFTTKPVGRGTGLGLATCFGIVAACGGHLWYYTELGRGTTFKVYLPQVVGEATSQSTPGAADPGGNESVLVVEDEPAVRRVTVRMLEGMGYRVHEAHNGVVALRMLSDATAPLDLVVTDMVMPEMGGAEMVVALRGKHPNARVLFLSGYAEEALAHNGTLDPGLRFLQKPFSRAELARAVREALG